VRKSLTTLRYETAVDNVVGTIIIDRPPINGMTVRMARELYSLLTYLTDAGPPPIVVITGSGGPGNGFCPGADIKHRTSGAAETELAADGPVVEPLNQIPRLLFELPSVTIAAINGACAGAGLGWALACDIRVVAQSAKFATAFLARGLSGDMGMPWSLLRMVGSARARELLFLRGKVDSATALRLGIVHEVWDDDEFVDALAALVGRLSDVPSLALRLLKANLIDAERLSLADYLDREVIRHIESSSTDASQAAFRAFMDR
jgi:2-(1,2-epoxy-1,2-dihydrophenyl)acetyl-CoA isomerase